MKNQFGYIYRTQKWGQNHQTIGSGYQRITTIGNIIETMCKYRNQIYLSDWVNLNTEVNMVNKTT
jgi:hypothetical protein